MVENPISGLILANLAQIWAPKIFLMSFTTTRYYIVTSYHCMQFQGKRMIQTQLNDKKLHYGPDLGRLYPNLSCQSFFFQKPSFVSH